LVAVENIIVEAEAMPTARTVRVTWANGAKTGHDFGNLVGKGVFSAFADPAFFARVKAGERGRSLDWPNEIDFCADALWFEARPADAPEQTRHIIDASAGQHT
jgi:hypothetical protein